MKTRSLRKEIHSKSYMQKPECSLSTTKVGGTFRTRLLENHLSRDIRRREEKTLFSRLIITKQAQI